MHPVLITNNPKAYARYKDEMAVEYLEAEGYEAVLETVRNAVHRGARLLTHPLAGSLKPNQTPYRSIIVDAGSYGQVDGQSLELIENSMESYWKFVRGRSLPAWNEAIRADFQTVDLSHIVRCVYQCRRY